MPSPLWMGITPGQQHTRILLLDEHNVALLKARLPQEPQHPHAIDSLCEALALWCGRRIHAALAVDSPGAPCVSNRWLDTFDAISRNPLYRIDYVSRAPVRRRQRDGLDGMGDFQGARQLLLFGGKR